MKKQVNNTNANVLKRINSKLIYRIQYLSPIAFAMAIALLIYISSTSEGLFKSLGIPLWLGVTIIIITLILIFYALFGKNSKSYIWVKDRWLWVLGALAIILLLIFLVIPSWNNSDNNEEEITPTVEQPREEAYIPNVHNIAYRSSNTIGYGVHKFQTGVPKRIIRTDKYEYFYPAECGRTMTLRFSQGNSGWDYRVTRRSDGTIRDGDDQILDNHDLGTSGEYTVTLLSDDIDVIYSDQPCKSTP